MSYFRSSMNPPQPDASRPKSPISRPSWRRKNGLWTVFWTTIVALLVGIPVGAWLVWSLHLDLYFDGTKSEADLATGRFRRTEYRWFIKTVSGERETEFSKLAIDAGYRSGNSMWVMVSARGNVGPLKRQYGAWDKQAHSLIINAGSWATLAKSYGQPKSVEWYQRVFDRLQKREYLRLWTELDEEMQVGLRAP